MSYQPHLSPPLPKVVGNKDYEEFQEQLQIISEMLVEGGVEEEFVEKCIAHREEELKELEKEEQKAGTDKNWELKKLDKKLLVKTVQETFSNLYVCNFVWYNLITDRVTAFLTQCRNMEILEERNNMKADLQKKQSCAEETPLKPGSRKRLEITARKALRCNIARVLTGDSYRDFSNRLAQSYLFQWFCLIDCLDEIRVPSKSSVDRYDKLVPCEMINELIDSVNVKASTPGDGEEKQPMGLKNPISLKDVFVDTSCVKANIHFPVDWVLLRDVVLSLIASIMVIRKHGLKNRMPEPQDFISQINNLCIQMGHGRRKKNARQERKRILRLIKDLVDVVKSHGIRYRDLLRDDWEQTDLSAKEAARILGRLDNVLEQLPSAVKQAHERIIGERPVKNEDKILSLHESEIHVIVRGKSGAEVEYGNSWVMMEQTDGIIVYSSFIKDQAEPDNKLLIPAIDHFHGIFGRYPDACGTDRGFDSDPVRNYLAEKFIYNGVCPKSPSTLQERLEEDRFCQLQKRRSQTEGRIGIFKNSFLGRPMRSKGFKNRELGVSISVLAHNLWCLARLPRCDEEEALTG